MRPNQLLRCTASLFLVGVGLSLTACGSSDSTTILDTQKVEAAIEQSVMDQRGEKADVACPSGVHQVEGLVFSCDATVRSATTRFVVTQVDDSGNVHYEAP